MGMNRVENVAEMVPDGVPHARGDEPNALMGAQCL